MRVSSFLPVSIVLALAATAATPVRRPETAHLHPYGPARLTIAHGVGPSPHSLGALAFGPHGVLYAADPETATIYALQLGASAPGTVPGTKPVTALGRYLAAALGTDASQVGFNDGFVVDPRTKNTYLTIERGQGANATPVLVRLDGAGKVTVIDMATLKFSSITLPSSPQATPNDPNNPRTFSITHLAFSGGQLYVSGLSNEQFASTLWKIAYPFTTADRGTSIQIFHDNHGQFETAAPIFTFVPYTLGKTPSLIAGYLCSPLVTLPVAALTPGAKVNGTTIADLGGGSRPIGMIAYKKGGRDYLLVSNTIQETDKLSLASIATARALTPDNSMPLLGWRGVPYTVVNALHGVQWLDMFGADSAEVVQVTPAGQWDLKTVPLP